MISIDHFKKLLDFADDAYHHHNKSDQVYRQSGKVPYATHPLGCAMLLIADQRIPWHEREIGFQALILHDVLEDTNADLPNWVDEEVKETVRQMTFESSDHALREASSKPIFIKLLMLLDGFWSMYEEHVQPVRRKQWKQGVAMAIKEVEQHYGNIRVVQIAKAIEQETDW
jgi:hypothetical protein